jgi:nucleotide-binding universal stress UspA family protein
MVIQHILVPLDFSPEANLALGYTIPLAQTFHARLTLLHVMVHSMPPSAAAAAVALPYSYLQDIEEQVQQMMDASRQRVRDAGLEADVVIVHGVPFQHIVDVARHQHVDLIVMGSHGLTGLERVLMGGVAEKVVRLAPCPVLITRPGKDVSTVDAV